MDLKLNASGDLDVTEGVLTLVDGIDRIRQQCQIRLRTFRGEWFRDRRVGMPYYQEILGVKPFNSGIAASRFRAALLGVPGVRDVQELTFDLNDSTRELAVSFAALCEVNGQAVLFTDDFVLT